jgi:hypothetical protein
MRPTLAGSIVILAIVLAACKSDSTSEQKIEDVSPTIKPLYLEGVYATSTRLPYADFSLQRILDGDEKTYWSTMTGAGPDEGFVLYFQEPTQIEFVTLRGASGAGLANITSIALYADGHYSNYGSPNDTIKLGKTISSLFVKVQGTDAGTTETVSSEDQGEQLSIMMFDSASAVGVSEFIVYGPKGPIEVKAPHTVIGSVTASSVLKPASAYDPAQLFDSRKEFVWAEGAKGSGENERLTFTFNEPQTITALKIWNGYQRSEKHFEANARVKAIEIGPKDGAKTVYELADSEEPQLLKLTTPLNGTALEMKVVSIFPGTSYKDLVISELVFYNDDVPFKIIDPAAEERHRSFISETQGSLLRKYLDKQLYNETSFYDERSETRSIILRSNKTFVLYEEKKFDGSEQDEDIQIVADGSWEVVEQNGSYAKIRVFGKLFNLSETIDYYKGNTSVEIVKIFQEHLTLTEGELQGEKFVDRFYLKPPASVDL